MAYLLWLEWFIDNGEPIIAGECGGDLRCFFCGCHVASFEYFEGNIPHEPDCIYVRAELLVQEQKGEN